MKKAVSVVLFLTILVLAVYTVSDLFIVNYTDLPYNDTTKIRGFFAEPQDTIDVVFVGASTSFMGINPSILWREYGIPSYNFCSAGQRIQLSQLYVKEAIRQQHPDVICLDIGGIRHSGSFAPSVRNYTTLNEFPLTFDKLYTIFTYTSKEEWASHLLPLVKFHSTGEVNFRNWDTHECDPYLGYSPYFGNYNNTVDLIANTSIKKTTALAPNAEKALREVIDVCRENNVDLVLYSIPMLLKDTERKRFNEVIRIAEDEGIPVLDMNSAEWLEENQYDTRYDNSNANKHPNWRGATKITRSLGDFLVNNQLVTDQRNNPAYASWTEKTEPYYHDERNYLTQQALSSPTELSEYLEALTQIQTKDTITVIAAYDEASSKTNVVSDELLMKLGAQEALSGLYRYGYLIVNVNGETVFFGTDDEDIVYFETDSNSPVSLRASSAGYKAIKKYTAEDEPLVPYNKVVFNGKEYTLKRGLNIFVYDYTSQKMLSNTRFDTYTTTKRSK